MKPEPKFVPKPGQVDYTNIRYCPVVNCVVRFGDEILLQQRAQHLRLYPGFWSGISGFLDTNDSIEAKVYEELAEEAGINKQSVKQIKVGQVLVQEAPGYGKTWIVFPVLVTLKSKLEPKLNWEAAGMQWVPIKAAEQRELLPGFEAVLATFFGNKVN